MLRALVSAIGVSSRSTARSLNAGPADNIPVDEHSPRTRNWQFGTDAECARSANSQITAVIGDEQTDFNWQQETMV